MQSVQKLIDYFLVVGLDQKLTPCKYPDEEEEKHITDLELFFGYITEEMKASQTENEKWIDLDGYQTVWLKVTYNKSSIPVISIDFLSIPTEKDSLKWNGSPNTQLVHIANLKRNDPPNRDSDVLIQRDFDLTEILGFERVPGHAIVLSYELQDKGNYKSPLEDVVCIIGERKRGPNGIIHELSNLEEGYESIKRKFVNKDKTFRCIAFKKGKDFLEKSFVPAVIDRYPQEIVHDTQEILSHIQMFCFPDGIKFSRQIREPTSFSFILTKESGARVYGTALVFDEDFPEELLDQLEYGPVTKEHPLFTQKAICLLSHYSFPAEFKEMLKKIYSIHISKNDIPLERYICNLIDETPLPIKGKVGILVDLGKPLHFKRAANYPIIASRAIHNLFTVFDAQKVIELVKMVLLEKKILLISKYKSLLTDISEALTGLIFPFVWVRPLIPILPVAWRDCLECLMPFLMGLNTSTISEDEVPIAEDVVRVYLDKGEIVCSEKIPQLPEKWYKSLFKRLEVFDAWHEIYGNTETNFDAAFDIHSPVHESEDQGLDVFEIQDAFFGLITSILKHYNKFFTPPKENKDGRADLKETFDITEFLKRKKAHKEGSFLYVLVKETSFFSNFIQARASFYKQGVEYQFIDNCIKKKRSKKEPTFIHYPDIEITFNTYAPNNADIPPGKKYSYKNFPKLNPALFIAPRIISNLTAEQESPLQVTNIEPQKLASLEDSKWAKLLLESIYTAWFSVFNVMLKEDFKNYFNRMAEYAILLFEDAKNRNIKPNEVMYKSLIEALCYCDMNEKALQIVNKLRDEKTELSPFAFGIYLDTMTQARKFRSKLKKGPDSEQGLELGQESFSQSDKNNSGILRCVNFQTHNKCPNCSEILVSEDIASGWKKSYNEYTTTCRYCSKSFLATLKVIEQCEGVSTESAIHFLSPLVVRKELENLFKKKGTSVLLSDAFKKDHATIYWNMYLYFNLIKAPSSLLETDLSQAQVLKNLDALEELLQNSQEEKKKNWNFSFFSNMTKSKTVISREEISQIGSIDKQANAKTSESTKISNDSIRMNIINDPPELNSQLRKTFFNLFSDMHKELDRRQEEYEVELKFKKGVCPADSHFLEETQEYCKSPGEDVSAQES